MQILRMNIIKSASPDIKQSSGLLNRGEIINEKNKRTGTKVNK